MVGMSWLLVAAAVLGTVWVYRAWRGHREFVTAEGTFRCRVRVRSASLPGFPPRWSRSARHARWVHDVLIIRSGLLAPRVYPLAVHVAEGELVELDRHRVRGLGSHPVSVLVLLDHQAAVEVATAERNRSLLAGPFVVL